MKASVTRSAPTVAVPVAHAAPQPDQRPQATAQLRLQDAIAGSHRQVAQRQQAPRRNATGLPDNLKTGVESLSGHSLDDVKVHYNSAKPVQLQALAYAQGTDIHLGPGQEKHLPHEAWHVVQRKQGRVQADGKRVDSPSATGSEPVQLKLNTKGDKIAGKAASIKKEVKATIARNTPREMLDDIAALRTSIAFRTNEQSQFTAGTPAYIEHTGRIGVETQLQADLQAAYDTDRAARDAAKATRDASEAAVPKSAEETKLEEGGFTIVRSGGRRKARA